MISKITKHQRVAAVEGDPQNFRQFWGRKTADRTRWGRRSLL